MYEIGGHYNILPNVRNSFNVCNPIKLYFINILFYLLLIDKLLKIKIWINYIIIILNIN